jgi:CelD/BcsL family acetyltransferase involved in cellulose biosynthesis
VSVTTTSTGVTFETISTEAAFAGLVDSWDDQVRAMRRPTPHLLHAWLLTWWRHYGQGNELAIQIARRDGRLVGALPVCVIQRGRLRVLTFLGAEQTAMADLMLAEGESDATGAALVERAVSTHHDFADFYGLPSTSRLAAAMGSEPLQLIVRAEAPVLELDGDDWETVYRSRLSSNQRALHRRRRRQLAKLGTLETTISRTRDELGPTLEDAFALHALRWSGRPDRSEFATTTGKQFHREATAALADLDAVRIVTLKLDGRAIAFVYYFKLEERMFCHRLAFDPAFQRMSPGAVNRFDALDAVFAEGATRVEFFGGTERYKIELTDRLEPLCEGLGLANTTAGKIVMSGRLGGIRLRRFVKRSPAIRRFYYEGLAPARRLFRGGTHS